jgi:hypothetical protein
MLTTMQEKTYTAYTAYYTAYTNVSLRMNPRSWKHVGDKRN